MLMISNTAAFIWFFPFQKLFINKNLFKQQTIIKELFALGALAEQRFVQKLSRAAAAGVSGGLVGRKLDNAGVEIHPAVVGKSEALVYPCTLESLHGIGIGGIANKQRRNVRAHMTGLGLNVRHTLVIGIVTAPGEYLLRQMRNGENVNILVAVGLPKLCGFDENILLGVNIEKAGGCKLGIIVVETFNVKVSRIAVTELVYGFKTGHLTVPPID